MQGNIDPPKVPDLKPLTNGHRDPMLIRVAEIGLIGIALLCILGGMVMEYHGHESIPVVWSLATSCVWAIIHLIQSRPK